MKINELVKNGDNTEVIIREMTAEEELEHEAFREECQLAELNHEPTDEERFEAQLLYTALMTDTLI